MDDMWNMFEKGQRSANPVGLEEHVNELIQMTTQGTAWQNRIGNRKDIPFELLDLINGQSYVKRAIWCLMKDGIRLRRYSKMSETKEELNSWCISNNPKILKKNKDVKELMSDLCEREEFYKRKMAECEERARRSIKIYQGKINRIHKVMKRLEED